MSRDSETPFFKAHLREACKIKKCQPAPQINASLGRKRYRSTRPGDFANVEKKAS
jgi:hypothetical protein